MQEAAAKKDIKTNIWAVGDAANILASGDYDSYHASKKADIILLGPQIKHLKETVKARVNNYIPVSVIDMRAYGMMNGELVLNYALQTLEDYNHQTEI